METKKLCDYGCGQEGKHYLSYAKKWCCSKSQNSCNEVNRKRKESLKGKEKTVEHCKNISKSKIGCIPWNKGKVGIQLSNKKGKSYEEIYGEERTKKIKEKKSKKKIEEWKDPNSRFNSREYRKLLSDSMKNGRAAYLNKFIKNPSKPELKLREIVKELFPLSEPTKVMNYCIDVGIQKYKIAIEYDGYYHFCDQEHINYHKKRQKEIENDGWRFIRYNIFQSFPTQDQVKKDIEDIINVSGKNR